MIQGNVLTTDTTDSLFYNYTKQLVVTIDGSEMFVVVTPDVVLVCKKDSVGKIKTRGGLPVPNTSILLNTTHMVYNALKRMIGYYRRTFSFDFSFLYVPSSCTCGYPRYAGADTSR